MNDGIIRAKLKNDIPAGRYLLYVENVEPPRAGDIVELDHGYTGEDGLPMGTVYHLNKDGEDIYQAEVYETELELINNE